MKGKTTIYFDPITITRYIDEIDRYETETYEYEDLDVDTNVAISKLGEALASKLKIGDEEAFKRAKDYIDLYESTDPEKYNKIDMDNDLEYKLLCKCFMKNIRNKLYKQMDKDYTIWGRRSDYVLGILEEKWYDSHPSEKMVMKVAEMELDVMNIVYRHTNMTEEEMKRYEDVVSQYMKFSDMYRELSCMIEDREAKEKAELGKANEARRAEEAEKVASGERPARAFGGFTF